jgi:hypothetical protein
MDPACVDPLARVQLNVIDAPVPAKRVAPGAAPSPRPTARIGSDESFSTAVGTAHALGAANQLHRGRSSTRRRPIIAFKLVCKRFTAIKGQREMIRK